MNPREKKPGGQLSSDKNRFKGKIIMRENWGLLIKNMQ